MELVAKRKKRKTRRSLNELRKKFNGNLGYWDFFGTNLEYKTSKTNCVAGDNRLTLGLFHKAVRSETITRASLPPFKQLSILNENKVMNKKNCSTNVHYKNCSKLHDLSTSYQSHSYSHCNIAQNKSKCKIEEMNYSTQNKENSIVCKNKLSSTPILHSPIKLQTTKTMFETSETVESLSLSASSLESFWNGDGHHLYEEFINSMSKYLFEKTPALLKTNIMKQTKDFLHDIYIHSYHCETENNILQCIQKNVYKDKSQPSETSDLSHKTIQEDTFNYIKMKYTRQKDNPCETITSLISSPNSTITEINISDSSQSSKQHTPEYIYFPHKLNE